MVDAGTGAGGDSAGVAAAGVARAYPPHMDTFRRHLGTWRGTNDFRLLPTDPFDTAPAEVTVSMAAGGNLATLSYTWSHPDDGEQDGLLVVGPGEEDGALVAFWGDSWHQHPSPTTLLGTVEHGLITLDYEYGEGWRWQIFIDVTDEVLLQLRMDNVVPDGAQGPDSRGAVYSAMVASLTR